MRSNSKKPRSNDKEIYHQGTEPLKCTPLTLLVMGRPEPPSQNSGKSEEVRGLSSDNCQAVIFKLGNLYSGLVGSPSL